VSGPDPAVRLPDPQRDRRQRRLLVGLAVLFFAPVAVAFYLYYGAARFSPVHRVNRGALIQPPLELPAEALPLVGGGTTDPHFLEVKWTLVYVDAGDCAETCRRKLYETRQVRLALDRDMTRVQRVFIAEGACCDTPFLSREHPDLVTVRVAPTDALVAALPAAGTGRVYVVDPHGNLMMYYASESPPKGLLEDMKRLLKLSHIG
jgi:cytochrome oxidase Cu insertion factor (SCO1/SenC/PrrC family)